MIKKWGILIKMEIESFDFIGLEIPRVYYSKLSESFRFDYCKKIILALGHCKEFMGKKKQYPEVEKLLALIEERKAKGITPKNKGKKVTKSKEVIKNSKNLKASQRKTDLIVPDGECVYVGFTESHECTGKMVGSLLRSDKILVYK